MAAKLVRYGELTPADIRSWNALLAQDEAYDSALLTPEFAGLVSSIRDDVRILLLHNGNLLEGILAFHKRPGGLARPLGAPFSDYSGPVIRNGSHIKLTDLLSLAGVPAFESAAMVGTARSAARDDETSPDDSHIIRPAPLTGEQFLEQQRSLHAKRFKNFRRLHKQFEREIGPLKFNWGRPSSNELETLLALKSDQFLESGYVDLTQATESRALLSAVASSEHAFMTSLTLDDTLVSAHFGFKCGKRFHPWISAYDPQWSSYSPGILLLLDVLKHWEALGVETYDLAGGHDHYKKYFANAARPNREVFAASGTLAGWHRKLRHGFWIAAGANREGSIAGRLKRRMDQIAACEISTTDRLREFTRAVISRTVSR